MKSGMHVEDTHRRSVYSQRAEARAIHTGSAIADSGGPIRESTEDYKMQLCDDLHVPGVGAEALPGEAVEAAADAREDAVAHALFVIWFLA